MRQYYIVSVACPALPYVTALSHTRHDFQIKIQIIKCVFLFYLQHFCETFLIVRRIQRGIIINVHYVI
jgi:hypothetical protein